MDFTISEEQAMLRDSVARLIDDNYDFDQRQRHAASEQGFDTASWQQFGELGWTAVPFSEDDGGLGGGAEEVMLMMEQFGRGLIVEPYLASIIMAGGVLRRLANDSQKQRFMHGLLDASQIGALAFVEPQSRYCNHNVACSLTPSDDGYLLSGNKAFVISGGGADFLIVSARSSGEQTDRDGISLLVVDAAAAGITTKSYPTVDGLRAAEITFSQVPVSGDAILGELGKGYVALAQVIDEATLAVCGEAVGIMETLNLKTLDYTKNRQQFGVPIASFQALQHRMVDMFTSYELTKSLLLWAVMAQASGSPSERSAAISAIKHQVGTAGRKLGQEAVQLHGGMGVTWELDVAHYFKRLTAIDTLFGNADFHLARYTELSDN